MNEVLTKQTNTWKEFKQRFGEDTTTNIQLMQMAKILKIPNFYYVMRDEMNLLPTDRKPLNVMTNIHTSKENGVHHSCFYMGELNEVKNNENFFFDSYGLPPTKEVEHFMRNGVYNTFKIQEDRTKYCGQMSLYVLYRLQQGDSLENSLQDSLENSLQDKFTDIVLSLKNELKNSR